jgi:hypothetical protein
LRFRATRFSIDVLEKVVSSTWKEPRQAKAFGRNSMSPGRDNPRLDQDPRLILPQLRLERQAIRYPEFERHTATRNDPMPLALGRMITLRAISRALSRQ